MDTDNSATKAWGRVRSGVEGGIRGNKGDIYNTLNNKDKLNLHHQVTVAIIPHLPKQAVGWIWATT